MWRVTLVGITFAVGCWLLIGVLWPARRSLAVALRQLHTTGAVVAVDPTDRSLAARVGRRLLRRQRGAALLGERLSTDLALLHRPLELHAGLTVLGAITGAFAAPVVIVGAALAGVDLPVIVPIWLMITGAAVGGVVPTLQLRSAAAAARRDARHAIGAYLDVLILLLAAHEGPESAMEIAAESGNGPAFDDLRRATWRARLAGEAIWDELRQLGEQTGLDELVEIAAAGALAGESGAAVRRSLTAKARSLRASSLADAEASARRQSQAMFAPLVMLGIGFIVFLIYPLVTNLNVGGG